MKFNSTKKKSTKKVVHLKKGGKVCMATGGTVRGGGAAIKGKKFSGA